MKHSSRLKRKRSRREKQIDHTHQLMECLFMECLFHGMNISIPPMLMLRISYPKFPKR
jgi:hypothetical protein